MVRRERGVRRFEAKRFFPGFDDVVNGPLYCSGTSSTSTTVSCLSLPFILVSLIHYCLCTS